MVQSQSRPVEHGPATGGRAHIERLDHRERVRPPRDVHGVDVVCPQVRFRYRWVHVQHHPVERTLMIER